MKTGYSILFMLFATLFHSAALSQAPTQGAEGVWNGVLDVGGTRLRLELTIRKSSTGSYDGVLNSIDQSSSIPLDSITVEGDRIKFEIKAIGASYEGTINKEKTEITGTFTQGGNLPLVFRKGPSGAPAGPPAAAPPPVRPISVPLDTLVATPPTALKANGKTHLVYEMSATNFGRQDCALVRIEALGSDGSVLGKFEGSELRAMLLRPGVPQESDRLKIAGGLRAIAFIWVSLDAAAPVPTSLSHRLAVKIGDFPEEMIVTTPRVPVAQKPIVISPPLKGDGWLAANGPSNTSGHRRAMLPVDGAAHIAQRFAIDWVQKREDGRTFTGDAKDNKNYRCYGADALAVADGVVAAVKDGIPENIPGPASRAVPITLETVGGNHVILDLGEGRFAFYAHLQPGSLKVKLGDKVRRGQVLGLVGNSGNSTEPHLHFHISNGNSPLGSDGLPYVFGDYEVQGQGTAWKPSDAAAVQKRRLEIPTENQVIRFLP